IAPAGRPATGQTSALRKERNAAPARQVIDISSEDEPILQTSSLSRAAPSMKQHSLIASRFRDDHRRPPTTSMGRPEQRKTASAASKLTPPKPAAPKPLLGSLGSSCRNPSNKS